jgi:Tripartite tricarboxylate transporter TctB family
MNKLTKDRLGGALLLATGAAAVVAGSGYGMGTLRQMGSGFYPVVLGMLLALIGVVLLATATRSPEAHLAMAPAETAHLSGPVVQWRGWLCILGGALAFVVLGQHGGLVPASFVSVFVAALGDRNNSVRDAALLAALLTILGVVVFHYGLHLLLPLFQW